MLTKGTIKLSKSLWEKVRKCAEAGGYSSPQEFVEHVLDRETAKILDDAESNEDILRKLKGLGYID